MPAASILVADDDGAVTPLAAGEVEQESVARYEPPAESVAPDDSTGGE